LEVIDSHRPSVVAVEKIFHASNALAALKLGHSRGIAVLAAAHRGLPVYEYSALEVKKAVTGFGGATKEQVQEMVLRLTALRGPLAPDASDALAVALCHLHSEPFREAIAAVAGAEPLLAPRRRVSRWSASALRAKERAP
ncbi:MAG: crossover junction endodeoxyribonuclease RuvC, partial [Vicinamibacteria bacterium]